MNDLIEKADAARKYWTQNALDEFDSVLLLPHRDERLNTVLCNMLAGRLKNALVDRPKILVLSVDKLEESKLYTLRTITRQAAENLIYLYCLYEFTDKLIIGSMELPYGRKAKNFLDCGVASETDMADAVLFGGLFK